MNGEADVLKLTCDCGVGRGPVTKHIEDLEAHIRAMYDDLVEEFAKKKEQTQVGNALWPSQMGDVLTYGFPLKGDAKQGHEAGDAAERGAQP
jgi:hypothetical protein